ncbi:MAG: magnesium/cobalt transporter CorA [Woeseiaceae bacterium]|nr:magnesium/cobalt transporter CorA [Woeseiaceae bacterium]
MARKRKKSRHKRDPRQAGNAKRRHDLHHFPGRFTRPGNVPGDLSPHPAEAHLASELYLTDYSADRLLEKAHCTLAEARQFFDSPNATWLHVQGTPDPELLHATGNAYGLHRLALEDVLHTGQRPKLETYDGQLFCILAIPELGEHGIVTRQLSLFLGDTWLVSFYSGEQDPFTAIRERTRQDDSRIRRKGVDYLFYALVDLAIDLVFPVMEQLGDRIEALELTVFDDPSRDALDEIHRLKRELVLLRRLLWPQRDMLAALLRDDHRLVTAETRLYLRDCYDHGVHALDLVESYREMASSLLEVYLSSLSNRMNDIMKVLTIIATIFIPLSFIAGVYGMNFDTSASPWNMPELGLRYGYPLLLLVMLAVVAFMILYFRRKDWL